jgi:uncharacterized membrane protein
MTLSPTRRLTTGGVLLGVGLGGFVDGIVLHQILQWHHLLTSEGSHPATTVAGLEANTLADGLFHAATWVATLVGLMLVWTAPERIPLRRLIGLMLAGWGGFNLVEGVVDHHILTLHHVKTGDAQLAFDLGYLALGAALLAGGLALARSPSGSLRRLPARSR